MTDYQILLMRRMLEALGRSGAAMTERTLADYAEAGLESPVTTLEGKETIGLMLRKGYIASGRNPVTDNVTYVITAQGRNALAGIQ